ncbi:MAG: hypothetical protein MK008_04315 [Bdellovibrionales bacterium]|nr:hypothetical protein [Bdellovibrionales bacterium]
MSQYKTILTQQSLKLWLALTLVALIPISFNSCKGLDAPYESNLSSIEGQSNNSSQEPDLGSQEPNPGSQKGVIFYDSFESQDLSTTNSEGFSWHRPNRTSLVNSFGYAVWNGRSINNGPYPDRFWEGFNSDHSMRFRYPAGETWAEQRFSIGAPKTEIWISYMIRIPINYSHGVGGGSPTNNKFISLWMDDYSHKGDGSSFWLSMENAGNGNTDLAFTYSLGSYKASEGMRQHAAFINANEDKGRWVKIVIHLKAESSPGAKDGVVETWRRWESESDYVQLHGKYDVPFKIPANGPNGFYKGYLLGWANGTYSELTEWLIDDFTLSSSSLL